MAAKQGKDHNVIVLKLEGDLHTVKKSMGVDMFNHCCILSSQSCLQTAIPSPCPCIVIPRHTCAVRGTVVVLCACVRVCVCVCVCVCLSVCLSVCLCVHTHIN